jgi:dTDP-4-dehydrorhamnose reductase
VPQIDHTDVSIFLFSNEGVCSWYDFANAIFEMTNMTVTVNVLGEKDYMFLQKILIFLRRRK